MDKLILISYSHYFWECLRRAITTNYESSTGMGQALHLWNWVIGKGVQMKVRWRSADQMEKQGIRLHVACILLVGVLGQNVTRQKVTDTMSRTKYYEDKMLLVKMSSYFPRHFVQWHFVHITFCPRHFFRDILSGDISSGHPCRNTAPVQPARRKWGYVESQN